MICTISAIPCSPATSADSGSKRTSPSARCGSCSSIYGGLLTIMSNCCPCKALNQSLCSTQTLSMARCCLLRVASATASGMRSTAVTAQSGRSVASASAMAPVPVPKSRIRHAEAGRRASACSTRHSVSGRGISVAGETNSGSDQNSRTPVRCATGSPR